MNYRVIYDKASQTIILKTYESDQSK